RPAPSRRGQGVPQGGRGRGRVCHGRARVLQPLRPRAPCGVPPGRVPAAPRFRGAAITDSVSVFGSDLAVPAAKRAIRAGADLVLLTNGPDAARVIEALVP